MDPRTFLLAITMFLAFTSATIITVAKYWFGRPRAVDNRQLEEITQRLSRLEQGMDAIAVETERISEGQRFTTKLLSERAKSAPAGADR